MTGTSIGMTTPAALRPSAKFGGKMMNLLHSFLFITVFSSMITACSMEESSKANVTNQVESTTKDVTTGIINSLMMSKAEKEMLKDLVDEGPIFEKSKILASVINTGVVPVSTGSWIQVDLCTQKGCSVMPVQEMPLEIITPRTDGEAHDLGVIEIDSALLTEVRLTLSDDMGRTTIKSARLKDPLFLQYLAEKARLLIAVENDEKCLKGNCLSISSVTAVPDSPRAKYLYYNPSTGSSQKLNDHVQLNFPEGALPYAQVFMTGIDDQGKEYPKLDIFPRPVLDKPMNITISREKMISSSRGNDVQDNKFYEIKNLEFIDRYYDVGVNGLRSKNGSVKAIYNIYDCIKALNGFAVQAQLNADLLEKGYYYDKKTCSKDILGVHIAVADSAFRDIYYDVMFSVHKLAAPLVTHLSLRRVTDYVGMKIVINGFTWRKDKGFQFQSRSMGVARGYVKGFDFFGSWGRRVVSGNGSENSPYASDGRKRVFRIDSSRKNFFWESMESPNYIFGDEISSVGSSSTSIIKDGKCVGTDELDRWSAIGTNGSSRVVFISSSSRMTIRDFSLCEIFQVFGVKDAIRLDGGSAASLAIDGNLVNPLAFPYDAAFGNSRRVAWVIGVR